MIFSLKSRNLVIATALAITFISIICYLTYAPVKLFDKEPVEVVVKNGQSVYDVAETLHEKGLIMSQNIFVAYVRLTGHEKTLKAGKYILSKSLNIPRIVNIFAKGLSESEDVLVTIPEGFNIWEVDRRFSASGLISVGRISKEYLSEEGHLFPDTYRFKEDVLPDYIIDKMEENYSAKSGNQSNEILVTASLLEKEAKSKEDMELVAGIIRKRLEVGMPLQIDASVAYGWCLKESAKASFRGFCDVTQAPIVSEIKIDGQYNLYIRKGLPPSPISNPGIQAIQATLNPKKSDYLYYLSTRDGSQIIYSKTPAEHAMNRRKYLGI